MTEIDYGPDVSPEEYAERLEATAQRLADSLGIRRRPTPADMPKQKRRGKQ